MLKRVKNKFPTIFSIAFAGVLAVAAYGKFFYPTDYLQVVDLWVSLFEVAFLLLILIFRNRARLWLFSSVIFASWCGYAIYWYFLKLPCSCMGEMLKIPTTLTLSLDGGFVFVSLWMARRLGASNRQIYLTILSVLMAALVGYAFGDWVYLNLVPKP